METNENTPVMGGEVTEPTQNQEEKKLTQADVDSAVKARLARETAKWEKKVSDYENQLADLNTKLAVGSKVGDSLNEVLQSLKDDLDPEKLSLIPETLPIYDRINYIMKNKRFLSKQVASQSVTETTPDKKVNLPPSDKKISSSTTGLYGGKYETLLEFAQQDPTEYRKWSKANPR